MLSPHHSPIVAAVEQTGSVAFDTPTTIERLDDLTANARNEGADLVVFPEAFLGGYPEGHHFDSGGDYSRPDVFR